MDSDEENHEVRWRLSSQPLEGSLLLEELRVADSLVLSLVWCTVLLCATKATLVSTQLVEKHSEDNFSTVLRKSSLWAALRYLAEGRILVLGRSEKPDVVQNTHVHVHMKTEASSDGQQVGLSIDGDEDEDSQDELGLGLRGSSSHSAASAAAAGGVAGASAACAAPAPSQPSMETSTTQSPEILLAFGSNHGAAAYSLHGGGSGHGMSGNRWSVSREGSSRHGSSLHGASSGGIMPRRVSWPSGMSLADFGLDSGDDEGDTDDGVRDIELGAGGAGGRGQTPCYICCVRRADAVLMECGHGGVCFACAQQLVSTPPAQCPVCRHTIQEVLKFGGVVNVPSGGNLGAPLPGGGGGNAKTPDSQQSASLGISDAPPVVRAPGSSSSTPVSASTGQPPPPRVVAGSLRRFAEPDVARTGAPVPAAGVSTQSSVAQTSRGAGGAGGAAASRREPSPPARDPTRRELEAQGLSEEGGWLDPV